MGIFPIIMNILQFWLIDSIVKASGTPPLALDGDNADLYTTQDREPLFRAPDDENDDDADYRPNDIERSRIRSSSPPSDIRDKRYSNTSNPEEHKSYPASSSDEPIDHSYPPSIASSASTSSNQSAPPRPAKNLLKNANRRAPPAPLSLQHQNQPAVNSLSPAMPSAQTPLPQVPLVLVAAPTPKAPPLHAPHDSWSERWEDSDDWANRVGEEDWAGRMVDPTRDSVHNAWGNSAIQVA